MALLGELLVRLRADITGFQSNLQRAASTVQQTGQQMQSAGLAMSAAISLPLAGVGLAAIRAAGQMEATQIAFTTMAKSADVARQHIDDLKKFTLQTPFQFEEVTRASRLMQAYGMSINDVIPKLRIFGNTVSALGGGSELLERVVRSMGEIGTRGKITGEQLRELSRAGIPALEAVAKKMGVTVADAQKAITAGAVDAKTASEALLGYMETRFSGGMEAMSKGILGSWSNIKDKITFTLAEIGDALLPAARSFITNFADPALSAVKAVAEGFSILPTPIQGVVLAIGGIVTVAPLLVVALGAVVSNAATLYAVGIKLTGALAPMATQFVASSAALRTLVGVLGLGQGAVLALSGTLITLAAVGIPAAIYALYSMGRAIYDIKRAGDDLAKTNKTADDSLARLATSLVAQSNRAGLNLFAQDVEKLRQAWAKGEIDAQQYLKGLQGIAIALGDLQRQTKGTAADQLQLGDAIKGLGLKSSAELKKAYDQAKSYYDLIKISAESSGVKQAALQKLNQAYEELYGTVTKFQKVEPIRFSELTDLTSIKIISVAAAAAADYREKIEELARAEYAMMQNGGLIISGPPPEVHKGFKQLVEETDDIRYALGMMDPAASAAAAAIAKVSAEQIKLDSFFAKDRSEAVMRWFKEFQWPAFEKGVKDAKREMTELEREVRRAFDGMTRHLARNIVEWKGWGQSALQVAKDLASGMLEIFLQRLFKPLQEALVNILIGGKGGGGILGGLASGIGGIFGGLFGGGGSAAVTASTSGGAALDSIFGTLGSGGSAAGSAVGAGFSSVTGMVTGIASAVSSVIGNFQMAGMNKSLDILVKHTLETVNWLRDIKTEWDPAVKPLQDLFGTSERPGYLWTVQATYMQKIAAAVEQMASGGGQGGGIAFNNCSFGVDKSTIDLIMNQVINKLRAAGAIA